MQHGSLARFGNLLQALRRCAETVPVNELRHASLDILSQALPFDRAIWGHAAIGSGLAFREAVFIGFAEEAREAVEAGASSDPRLMTVLANPQRSLAYSIADTDPPMLLALRARFGIGHVLSTARFDDMLGIASGVVLTRHRDRPAFSEAERDLMEAAFPHLLDGWAEGQLRALRRAIDAASGAPRLAAVSCHETISVAEPEFIALFREEFADWHGPHLPPAIRRLLGGPPGSTLRGRRIVLRWEEGADTSLLVIRRRVAADDLTARERQVADLVAIGLSYREIAGRLGIAPATARNHVASVHRRLGVSRNSEVGALLAKAW